MVDDGQEEMAIIVFGQFFTENLPKKENGLGEFLLCCCLAFWFDIVLFHVMIYRVCAHLRDSKNGKR